MSGAFRGQVGGRVAASALACDAPEQRARLSASPDGNHGDNNFCLVRGVA